MQQKIKGLKFSFNTSRFLNSTSIIVKGDAFYFDVVNSRFVNIKEQKNINKEQIAR